MEELAKSVMNWWEENKHNCYQIDGEDYNMYDEEPEFVTIAKRILNL